MIPEPQSTPGTRAKSLRRLAWTAGGVGLYLSSQIACLWLSVALGGRDAYAIAGLAIIGTTWVNLVGSLALDRCFSVR